MTVGFPDWQGYAKWQGQPFVSLFGANFPPGPIVLGGGVLAVPNFRGIYINHSSLAANHQISTKWYADALATQLVLENDYDFHGGESLNVVEEAIAPFLEVVANNLDVNPHTGTITVAPTNSVNTSSKFGANAFGRKLVGINQAIGAGGNFAAHSSAIYSGPATLAVQQAANSNWHAQLQSWNALNAAYDVLAEIDGATAGRFYVGRVSCTRGTMQVQVFNDDVAPQNMIASLVAG